MKLYTFAGNTHALQTLIVARYNGVDIEVPAFEMGKDNKSAAFLKKSPLGKVPVLETASGCICEAAAVARLHARS
uniref:GST N-terminal domain-containing protein n=2 Tax=Emiliania huxleyi TaxID=2903 RepID=A0A0D3JV92_EMIH1